MNSSFSSDLVATYDEPVRRYLTHALGEGVALGPGVELNMTGHVKVGGWLPFAATERCDSRSFEWRARVGWRRFRPLEVVDSYAGGRGQTAGRLLNRFTLFHSADADTARSAACRAALEAAVWAPASVIADPDVEWRAENDEVIVASWPVGPERPEVRLQIDRHGAVKSAVAARWGNAGQNRYGYIPCGCGVREERRFGQLLLPSRVTVGWWFGTPRYAPFFKAEVLDVNPA